MALYDYARRMIGNTWFQKVLPLGLDPAFNYFLSLFLPDTDLGAPEFGFKLGDQIFDFATGMYFEVVEHNGTLYWTAVNGTLTIALATANVDAFKFVTLTESGGLMRATQPSAQGALTHGVALNPATVGQRVYVLTRGQWYVRSGTAISGGDPATTSAAATAETAASADNSPGYANSGVLTRSAVNYQIITFSGASTIIA